METKNIFSESGIIITLLLIAIPVIVASILVIIKAKNVLKNFLKKKELEKFNEYLKNLSPEEVQKIEQRKKELEFSLSNNELAGDLHFYYVGLEFVKVASLTFFGLALFKNTTI